MSNNHRKMEELAADFCVNTDFQDTYNRVLEWQNLTDEDLRLRCGEMSAQEIRTVRAVLEAIHPSQCNSPGS